MIRRTAVRETGVFLHHGGLIECHPEILQTLQYYGIEGFKGASIGPPLYRETLASRADDVLFPVDRPPVPVISSSIDKFSV